MLHGGVVPADKYLGAPGGCVCEVEATREEIREYFQQRFRAVNHLRSCLRLLPVVSARQGMQRVGCMQVELPASSGLGEVNRCDFPDDRQAACLSSSLLTVWCRNGDCI